MFYVLNNIVIESKLIESKVTDRQKLDEINPLAAINYHNFFRKAKVSSFPTYVARFSAISEDYCK